MRRPGVLAIAVVSTLLLGLLIYVVAVISFAAGVTWLVVKITPSGPRKKPETPAAG